MNLIGAVDRNWAIGKDNRLLISIPGDMKLFRKLTLNKIVIVGRKTVATFLNGNPLMNRVNIVLSGNKDLSFENADVVHSLDELFEKLEELYLKGYTSDDVFVVGGESVYNQLEQYCDFAYITKIECDYEADAFFPNLDEKKEWKLTEQREEQTYFDIEYAFLKYRKIKAT